MGGDCADQSGGTETDVTQRPHVPVKAVPKPHIQAEAASRLRAVLEVDTGSGTADPGSGTADPEQGPQAQARHKREEDIRRHLQEWALEPVGGHLTFHGHVPLRPRGQYSAEAAVGSAATVASKNHAAMQAYASTPSPVNRMNWRVSTDIAWQF